MLPSQTRYRNHRYSLLLTDTDAGDIEFEFFSEFDLYLVLGRWFPEQKRV